MLDIGWSEMAVIALIALVIIGPKDLPRVMRTIGQWVRKAKAVSRDFQSSVDEMIREADLEDAKKTVQSTRNFNVNRALDETIDPTGDLKEEARSIDKAARHDESESTAKKPDGSASKSDASKSDASQEDEEAGATVIKHPVQPAPPHSVVPPKEPADSESALETTEPSKSSASGQKSA